jgi:hypothetical protein
MAALQERIEEDGLALEDELCFPLILRWTFEAEPNLSQKTGDFGTGASV